jgi:hypothetical protein
MRIFIMALALASIFALGTASLAAAAPNPSGTGQPSAECGSSGAELAPAGFSTGGFAHAESVYAGSDGSASAAHAGSPHAVSQYDVACYQVTSNQH